MLSINDKENSLGMCPSKQLVGRVGCRMRDAEGNIVFEESTHNNIVLNIRPTIIKLLAGALYTKVTDFPSVVRIKLGTDGSATNIKTDTELKALIESSEKVTGAAPIISEDKLSVTFAFVYSASSPSIDGITVREMGLFDRDDNMIARTTVGEWKKVSGLYFEIYWTIGYVDQE